MTVQLQGAQDYRIDPYLFEACQTDAERLCKGVQPEAGNVQSCLVCQIPAMSRCQALVSSDCLTPVAPPRSIARCYLQLFHLSRLRKDVAGPQTHVCIHVVQWANWTVSDGAFTYASMCRALWTSTVASECVSSSSHADIWTTLLCVCL